MCTGGGVLTCMYVFGKYVPGECAYGGSRVTLSFFLVAFLAYFSRQGLLTEPSAQ